MNVDLSYALNERTNLAGGAEWRNERFEIIRGSTESWTEGPLATQGFTPGSNGFTGFGPLTEGAWNRNNFAAYGDLEVREPQGAWTFGAAGRVERFSDFGTTVNGKLAGRVSASENLGLRASVSTGFRAPSPGQQNAFNISTIYDPAIMDLTNNGTIPSTSPLAREFGGEPLKPETSVNLALGTVYDDGPFSLSLDFFQIRVSDRLTTSADRELTPAEIEQLIAQDIIRPGGVLARFRFFINDFATRTDGIDLVGAYDVRGAGGSTTTFSSAWNWTRTTVTDFNPKTLTSHRIRILEQGLPGVRGNLAMNHAFPADPASWCAPATGAATSTASSPTTSRIRKTPSTTRPASSSMWRRPESWPSAGRSRPAPRTSSTPTPRSIRAPQPASATASASSHPSASTAASTTRD